ncbi:nicotinate-nucleotide--dimethylbenzimidazole phosphoribosyltransferase [Limnobaculum parvum]|uniref:Uncharacterized protein n=1 Tax=Limnobaculum parvum TaxID=2172103 RepID=A0A2Y9TUZ9_9GAMM|nr:hypothetical protein HYN51_02640 [Limnobaculum parvum]
MTMKLGEGSGAVIVFPIRDAACAMAAKVRCLIKSDILLP